MKQPENAQKTNSPGGVSKNAESPDQGGDEYDQDDFEKDDIVQMAEP